MKPKTGVLVVILILFTAFVVYSRLSERLDSTSHTLGSSVVIPPDNISVDVREDGPADTTAFSNEKDESGNYARDIADSLDLEDIEKESASIQAGLDTLEKSLQ